MLQPYNFILQNIRNRIQHTIKNPHFARHYYSKIFQYQLAKAVDGYLISYPKSGRTWLQRILVEALIFKHQLTGDFNDIYNLSTKIPGLTKVIATHAGSCWEESLSILNGKQLSSKNYSKFLDNNIVFMYRDPRDVLVSQYYHMKYRTNIGWITKSELINSPWIGLEKQIAFLNKWYDLKEKYPGSILFISYENLKKDTLNTVNNISDFWDLGLSEVDLLFGIENAAFEKMKSEETSKSRSPWNYTPDTNLKNSFHARNGQIGEYRNFFDNDEIQEINRILKTNLNSWYLDLYKIE